MKVYEDNVYPTMDETKISFLFHNTQGFIAHKEDIKVNTFILSSDIVCLCETWLQTENVTNALYLDNFCDPYIRCRKSEQSKHQIHQGGIMAYVKQTLGDIAITSIKDCTVEHCIIFYQGIAFVCIYRRPRSDVQLFLEDLNTILHYCEKSEENPQKTEFFVIAGDFNENLFDSKSHPIFNYFNQKGYERTINKATTKQKSCIDQIYIKIKGLPKTHYNSYVVPIYYSDHEMLRFELSPMYRQQLVTIYPIVNTASLVCTKDMYKLL